MSVQSRIQKVLEARQNAASNSPARKRIEILLDEGSFVEIDGLATVDNGGQVGVICGYGSTAGTPVAVFSQNPEAQSGAVGAQHAAKIRKLYELALKTGIPVVGIYDSRGGRLEEGIGALSAYGDMLRDINGLSGVVPQIAVVLGTCAGVASMLACSADFVIMSEKAELFIEAPSGEDDGSAQAAAKAGVAHIVCADEEAACKSAKDIITKLPLNNISPVPMSDYADPAVSADKLTELCLSAENVDPSDIVKAVCDNDSVVELMPEFGKSAYTAFVTMAGFPCGVVATNGMLDSDTSSKIAKIVSVCDAYQVPVITFVNSGGIKSAEGESSTVSIRDMARLAHVYAEATTPKISVITGDAIGTAFIALAGKSADYTIAWPSAVISPLPVKAAAAFLHGDDISEEKSRDEVEVEYAENQASAIAAASGGFIDDAIDPVVTRPAVLAALDLLSAKRVERNPKKHSNMPL